MARRASFLLLAALGVAPLPAAVVGSIAGFVHDDHGLPQMGAAVMLLNADGRSLRRVYTNDRGGFLIDDLFPGFYGVKVSVPAFLPAVKNKILIRSGGRSYLDVELASLLTSIRLVYPAPGDWSDMSEEWKWALRTAVSTRPVLRLQPWQDKETQSVLRKVSGAFSDVQGMVKVSAGDGGQASAFGSESDLGTAFAVATSLFGNSNLLVSGNLGYGSTRGAPSAGFHTSYSRELPYGAEPEVSLTVRQLLRPVEGGQALFGPASRYAAALQTFTFGFQDRVALGDLVKLEYGFQYDSISFLDRLNYASPFGKLTYSLGEQTDVILRYAGGVPRPDPDMMSEDALGRNLSALGLYPRMSLLDGRPAIQRGQHMEIGVERRMGENTVEVAAYRDGFSNATVTALMPGGLYTDGNILPDLFSNTSTFNAGSYQVSGYRAAWSRKWNDHVSAGLAYGLSGALGPERGTLETDNAGELRSILKPVREHSVTAQMIAQVPQAGTRVRGSYQWASRAGVTPADLYNASDVRALPGLNVGIRQPLPQLTYLPGRFEATAEFRNLLAQGYVPIRTADGRRMFLIQSARSFRGGFNFVF
ncbi:MAG TPA: TonB-dependent receptor [Bryobacterales bacterium]|nr:TonB-dependent receptor [Bryobacterales bacterium]